MLAGVKSRLQVSQVDCPKHGKQDETFVCQHIVQGLREGRPYGFFYPASSDEKRPNAWCTVCNELVAEENGEWTDQILEVAQVKLLCALCYDRAKEMNLEGGRKWWEFWKRWLLTRRSTGRQKRTAFGSLRWRSGAGYLSVS